jgi:beta-xylosidase
LREWFLLSSRDMVRWEKKVALRVSDFKWANANAWAGQMVTKGGKFYWYVPVQEAATGAMALGVAVADSPTGPFKDALGKPLVNDAFEMSNVGFANPAATPFTIDPTVFVDDDGRAYLHYGGFSRMIVAELNDDMISIRGKMREVTPQGFFEAPYLIKRNGTYYEIYAAGTNPATIDYATSNSPLGPWTRKGRIVDAFRAGAGEDAPTSHPAVAQFAGQWYLVYHLSAGPNGGGTYRREVAIDKLTSMADGSIQKIVPSAGLSF